VGEISGIGAPVPSLHLAAPTAVESDVFDGSFASRAGYSAAYGTDARAVARSNGPVLVEVTFEPRNSTEFFTPPSPGAAPLSISAVASRFGLTPSEYSQFEQYFVAHGLTVVHAWPDRLSLSIEGSATAMGAAFGTVIDSGISAGEPVTFPASPPQLPGALQPMVGSVLGLSSGFDAFSFPSLAPSAAGTFVTGSNEVTPAIARQIYDLSSLYNVSGSFRSASSGGIALLLWGYGYSPSDLSTFFSNYYPSSFPSPSIHPYPIDGAPAPSSNAVNDPCKAAQELTLDIEWAGSMAPGAALYPVYAPETNSNQCSPTDASMADALNQAVNLPVDTISMSFGTPDVSSGGLAAAWQTDFGVAVQREISLVAATGDFGGDAAPNCQGGAAPEYPSTSPDVLAVGGTQVSLQYGVLGGVTGFSETAWSQSGGGYSTQFSAPAWQPSGFSGRGVPDVAASAADNFVYYDGSDGQGGGTSFATPLWAGLVTEMDVLLGSRFGVIAPRLYAVGNEQSSTSGTHPPTGLGEVTTGSNCVASAGPGWNAVTGWGSPRALNLYEDLTATFVNLSVSARPATVAQGATVTISGHLANATDGASISGVPVTVSLSASMDFGPCTGTFGSTTVTTGAHGNISVAVGVPSCYFGSHAVAQLLVASDGYYGTNSTTIAVNLFGLIPALGPLGDYPVSVVTFVLILGAAAVVGYFLGLRRPSSRWPWSPPAAPPGASGAAAEPTPPPPSDLESTGPPESESR
jgi:kumamolisin